MTKIVRYFCPDNKSLFYDIYTVFDSGASLDLISSKIVKAKNLKCKEGSKTELCGAFGGNTCVLGEIDLAIKIDNILKIIRFGVVDTSVFEIIIGNPSITTLKLRIQENNVFTLENRILGKYKREQLTSKDQCHNISETNLNVSHLDNFFKKISPKEVKNLDIIKSLFYASPNAFSRHSEDVSCLPEADFSYIQEFKTDDPPAVKLYKFDRQKSNLINNEINRLVNIGILEQSDSNVVTANLLTVKKPDGSIRIVTDLRLVNKYTKPCNLALPDMREILQQLAGNKFYFKSDVVKAFWTSPVPKSQRRWYTVMNPKNRLVYQYKRMPMGHCHSAVHFQKMIDNILRKADTTNTFSYIDDVICGQKTEQQLIETLKKLLTTFSENNLKLSLDKTYVMTSTLKCFGYEVSEKGIQPDPNRVKKILEIPCPKTKKELLSCLASLNYYRCYIKNFAQLSSDLYAMTGSKSEFNMSKIRRDSFEELKRAFASHILATPVDQKRDFILETDASINGIGAVLKQQSKDGNECIIAVDSCGLKGNQKVWSIHHLELLAVHTGLIKFERYIGNSHVHIRVDNSCVFWLLRTKLSDVEITKRVPASRFLLFISTFDYSVEHVAGIEESFRLTDILSRAHERGEKLKLAENSKEDLVTFITGEKVLSTVISDADSRSITDVFKLNKPINEIHEEIRLAQLESKQCKKMKNSLPKNFELSNETLFKSTKLGLFIYCPESIAKNVLLDLHRHESPRQLLSKVNNAKIWIPNKYTHIKSLVSQCSICDPARSRALHQVKNNSIPNPSAPFQSIACDITGFGVDKYILVIVDLFTKFVIAKILLNSTSKAIIKVLIEVFTTFGLPSTVITDNATNFTSSEIQSFLNTFGVMHRRSSVLNSRGNAYAESTIKRLQDKLRIYQPEDSELPSFLNVVTFLLNTEKRESSKYTAFESLYHREASWIRQIPELSKTKTQTLNDNMKLMFEHAAEIQSKILEEISEKRKNIISNTQKIRFRENDHVRIKKLQKAGQKKKTFRPFSDEIYQITKIDRFTKVCNLKEVVQDELIQPRMLRMHCRFLSKVYKDKETTDDYEPFTEPENGTKNRELAEYSDQVSANKKSLEKNKREKTKTKNADRPKIEGTHKMTLRKR